MPKSERDLRLHIMVTHEELATIRERMAEVNSQNKSAFIRKMVVDGYAVNVDLALVKELLSLQCRSVNNLAQIAKYAKTHNAYESEIIELQQGYAEPWKQYFQSFETPCKVGCTLKLRAKLVRSQIRNERQRNDATLAGFGEAPQPSS